MALTVPFWDSAVATPTTDSQTWLEVDAMARIAPQTEAIALGTVRMGRDLPNPTLTGEGLLLAYSFGPWTLTSGAIFAGIKGPARSKEVNVQLPLAIVTYSHKFARATVSDGNRIEQLDGIAGAPWRYRNKALIDVPTHAMGPVSHVFAADEGFYDIATSQWNRNRAQAGVGVPLGRSVELQLFYLRQDSRAGLPRSLNVAGTTLVFGLFR